MAKIKSAIPNIDSHGILLKPIPIERYLYEDRSWYTGLNAWQRLNSHQTYSSVRRNANFKSFCKMNDHLDLVLQTAYQHDKETFPDPIDIYYRKVTFGTEPLPAKAKSLAQFHGHKTYGVTRFVEPKQFKDIKKFVLSKKLYSDHPIIIGGITERIHPYSVKLMNSSHHSPQTNAGYMRQDRDGMVFYY